MFTKHSLWSSLALAAALSTSVLIQSCTKDSVTSPTLTEFIADSTSFAGNTSWTLTKTLHGVDPLLGAMAHGGQDTTVTREVYFKNSQSAINGAYPIGTLLTKHSHNPAGTANMITAMAKRGNSFDAANNNWEYFVLNADGTIAKDATSGMTMRGANLMDGMCVGCHAHATTDHVFSK